MVLNTLIPMLTREDFSGVDIMNYPAINNYIGYNNIDSDPFAPTFIHSGGGSFTVVTSAAIGCIAPTSFLVYYAQANASNLDAETVHHTISCDIHTSNGWAYLQSDHVGFNPCTDVNACNYGGADACEYPADDECDCAGNIEDLTGECGGSCNTDSNNDDICDDLQTPDCCGILDGNGDTCDGVCGACNDDTSCLTIQQLIDAASDGDVVTISSGTYVLDAIIELNKNITLQCDDTEDCLIDATGVMGGINITAVGADVDGFQITGSASTIYGISVATGGQIWAGDNNVISNNIISGMAMPNNGNISPLSYGILTYGSSEITPTVGIEITSNSISNISGSGISLGTYSMNVTIANNTISNITNVEVLGQPFSVGIQAQSSASLSMSDNSFSNMLFGTNITFSTPVSMTSTAADYTDVTCLHSETVDTPADWNYDGGALYTIDGTVEWLALHQS